MAALPRSLTLSSDYLLKLGESSGGLVLDIPIPSSFKAIPLPKNEGWQLIDKQTIGSIDGGVLRRQFGSQICLVRGQIV